MGQSVLAWLSTTVFVLRYVNVPVFNLGKYFVMTYFVGLLWDAANIAALETKRYMSLHFTGGFHVSQWGRSRNNLFSGSNFELIAASLRARFRNKGKIVDQGNRLDPDLPTLGEPVEKQVSRWQGVCFELAVILLVLTVVGSEAASELYTDTTELAIARFELRNMSFRSNSSSVLRTDGAMQEVDRKLNASRRVYNRALDYRITARCVQKVASGFVVTRPNAVITHHHNVNDSLLCLYDEKQAGSHVKFTYLEPKRSGEYTLNYVDEVSLPHFSKLKTSPMNTRHLVLMDIGGTRFTCTKYNLWCVTTFANKGGDLYYRALYFIAREGRFYNRDVFWRRKTHARLILHEVHVLTKMWPLLARDRYMLRPRGKFHESQLQENLFAITVGYNWGWGTYGIHEGEALVEFDRKIVPTIQRGYIAALAIIVAASGFLLFIHSALSHRRKIRGLVGEHAFIDRWHGHADAEGFGDGYGASLWGRNKLIVVQIDKGVGHLQPATGKQEIPLRAVDKME